MYSGSTLTRFSGRMMGTHQKLDRVARKQLELLLPTDVKFPPIKEILHFEGKNGPDALKRKSPAQDEPGHFFNPFDEAHKEMFDLIDAHYQSLVVELKADNRERAAFEAAWLAHTLVDGLTPAHHYPYEEELQELRGGEGSETRSTIKDKMIIPGDTTAEKLRNNWKMWGGKGLMLTHGMFELGVATILKPLALNDSLPNAKDKKRVTELGPIEYFKQVAREIATLDMYRVFIDKGWTPKLAYQVRHHLGPAMVQTIALVWYSAAMDADQASK